MSRSRTTGDLLRRVGRIVLWVALAFVLVRGVASILTEPTDRNAASAPAASAERGFPDAEADAFAVSFTRAYLTFAPGHQEWVAAALRPYLSDGLREDAGLQVPEEGRPQIVEEATVARRRSIDERRALITVAATVSNKVVTTRYLTVPVARDAAGGLAVYDYPSIVPPPPRANVDEPESEDLSGAEEERIEALLERFFPVFFAGRTEQLDYFLPPHTTMRGLPEDYRFVNLVSVAQTGGARGRHRTVLAQVEVLDRTSGASYVLRYRIGLVYRDRWLVAALDAA